MRCEQIANCGGWKHGEETPKNVDAVVIVKRIPDNMEEIKRSGIPIIYDALDFWKQPDGDSYCKVQKFKPHFERIKPDLVICTNTIMQNDIISLGYDTCVIPHHYDPFIPKYKRKVSKPAIAYWGRKQYLGRYKKIIQQACDRCGYEFWINPPIEELSKVSAMVAFRDEPYDDYYSVAWKSNVKQATSQALKVPFYCFRERSYVEYKSSETVFVDNDRLNDFPLIMQKVEGHVNDFSLEYCTEIYKDTISSWLAR